MNTSRMTHTFALRPLARDISRACNANAAGLAMLLSFGTPLAAAGPKDGVVTAGQATIQQGGTTTTINQASQRAAINWSSFNVGLNETVNFRQPNANAVILNRVLGNDASAIYGRINANGQVYLVNPNGILFGRDARVDVGGLVASTANISNADFMAGKMNFNQPGKPGASVQNLGTITVAEGGLAALVGRGVSNSGVINARLGKVALAAGDAFVLDLYGDKLVNLIVDPAALASLADAGGTPLAAYVDQAGAIRADGGVVQLTASTVKSLVDNIINVSGVIRATSIATRAGLISLLGDAHTQLTLSGTLDVSGNVGGRIEATAGEVRLTELAAANASGANGGGSIAIGGDWQGRGALANAGSTSVARGALLQANATAAGTGGIVSVWSDGDTRFGGLAEARGGASSGNGGQVEVSGKQRLAFDGDVDASAAHGAAGFLLLDPGSLTVSGTGGDAGLPSSGAAGDFTINALAINRQLVRGTSVTLQADQDITVQADARIDGRANTGGTPGAGLVLAAGRNVAVDGSILLDSGAFGATAGAAFTQGAGSAIATGNGAIDIAGATGATLSNLLTTGKVALSSSAGVVSVGKAISGGAAQSVASLEVHGRDGVNLAQGALVAGATTLASLAGKVELGGTLASGGAVSLDGRAGVQAGAIVTPLAVAINSADGDVVLAGPVSGATGDVNATSARAGSLSIRTDGKVSLAGGALGAGGLTIGGFSPNTRAGSTAFGAGSLFSSGRVNVATVGDITLSAGGVTSASQFDLDSAQGSIVTGAGKIESAGAMRIAAGSSVTIGTGGAEVTGGTDLAINAGGGLTLDGKLSSTGGTVVLGAGGALAVNNDIGGAALDAGAGGRFTQKASSVISAGSIDIRGAAGIDAANLQTAGKLVLSSMGGAIAVAQALSRGASTPVATLEANGRDGVALAKGALVAGTTTLGSSAGTVDISGATLASGGAVNLSGQTGVKTGAIVTPASVLLTSAGGDVVLAGAVSGAPGTVDGSARAGSLTIRSNGAASVNGAALAGGGLTIEGAQPGTGAGSARFGAASVISAGRVNVLAAGDIETAAGGIDGNEGISFESSSGKVITGPGLLASANNISLKGRTGLTVGGNGLNQGGIKAGGDLTLEVGAGDLLATGLLQTAGGTIRAKASDAHRVTLNHVITWQQGVANSGALLVNGGQVVLSKALGLLSTEQSAAAVRPAVATGYTTFTARYQPQNRPPVGRVIIDAARDVELNGLNLDGLSEGSDTTPSDANPGLEVRAGNRIVSNGLIAVNKGNITLLARGTGPLDGIYLGNSVYSRGLDLSTGKTGYAVTVGGVGNVNTRSSIYLFDSTDDKAFLPSEREIAKIVIANNVENYSDVTTLVPATSNLQLPKVTVGADRLLALLVNPGALHLDAMPQAGHVTSDLALAPTLRAPDSAGKRSPAMGIGLKVQVFNVGGADGDKGTKVSEVRGAVDDRPSLVTCGYNETYAACGMARVDGYAYVPPPGEFEPYTVEPQKIPITPESKLRFIAAGGIIGFRIVPGDEGKVAGFRNLITTAEAPLLTTEVLPARYIEGDFQGTPTWSRPRPEGTIGYKLEGSLVQISSDQQVSRILFGPGALQTNTFEAVFDSSGNLSGESSVNPPIAGNSTMGSGANSNPGFPELGGFGTAPAGNVPAGAGNSAAAQGQYGGLPSGAAGAATGNEFQLPGAGPLPPELVVEVPPPVEPDVGNPLADSPPPVVGGPLASEGEDWLAQELADIAFGRRPAADADLGRGSAGSGAAPDVFRKRYRIARNLDASLCAPNDVATRAQAKADDKDARSCPPGQ